MNLVTIENDGDFPDQDSKVLAENIRRERDYIGLSQADVADALSIPRAAVSAFETGRRRVTGVELKRLAKLFGTSVDRLLGTESLVDQEPTAALFRATRGLSETDQQQVLRFAEFLRQAGRPALPEKPR